MSSVTFPVEYGGDGNTYTDDANPETGLDGLGYTVRFVPALAQAVVMGSYTKGRADAAEGFAADCETLRDQVSQSATNAASSESAASVSAASATASESAAASSATNAAASKANAESWAENAVDVEVEAGKYSSLHHATKAGDSASAASTSEINAESSASSASMSASNAATSESNAGASEASAQEWAEKAVDTEVEPGAYSSLHHATKAYGSASAAAASQSAAASSEANAASSENAASTSEANAATSEAGAATSANNASTSESNASASETQSQEWAENAVDVEVTTGSYSALHHATKAGGSASAASTSEGNAAASESAASISENNAANSASAASTSETNAASSASAAAASFDSFDDRYLGAKSSDPATDNDGDPLLTGALYFNSTTSKMREYNGSAWQDSYATVDLGGSMTGDISGGGQYRITGLLDPSAAQDAATKSYLDTQIGDIGAILDTINGEVV